MTLGSAQDLSDAELVEAIRGGSSDAEAALYARHRRKVVFWVTGRTGDPFVEDHYHDSYVKVLLPAIHKDRLREQDRVEAFLRTITLRLSLRSRKTKEVKMPEGMQWEEVLAAPDDGAEERREEAIAAEEARLLMETLETDCTPEERRLHRLYWVEGKELKELAKEEGIREVALRKRHSRMLIRIRQGMADRMWEVVAERALATEAASGDALDRLQAIGLLGEAETELLRIRYVGKRSWESVARRLGCSEREAAEELLTLLRRIRRDI